MGMKKKSGGKTSVKEEERKGRICIKPVFYLPDSDPHKLSGRDLLRIANEENLVLTYEEMKSGETLKTLAAKTLTNRRDDTFKKNTSSFFMYLCREILQARISEKNRMPLFEEYEEIDDAGPVFSPDIVFNGLKRTTYVEVKAASNRNKRPFFGARQTAGYLFSLLENKGSEVLTGIFFYGGRKREKLYSCKNDGGHRCDNRCLVKRLGHSVSNMLILPHNLLVSLLMLVSPFEMDQTSSQSTINREVYRRLYIDWINFLLKDAENAQQTISKIFEHASEKSKRSRKKLWPSGFSEDDFYLHDLQVKRYESPGNLYCRSSRGIPIYGINRFPVIEYKTPHRSYSEWIGHLREKLDDFLDGLWIKEEYAKIKEREGARKERQVERQAIQEADRVKMPERPEDGIPI